MKLRFRHNSLRLRVNRREVEALACGTALQEEVVFPNDTHFVYVFEPQAGALPQASFEGGVIRVGAPLSSVQDWAHGDSIGLYFDVSAQNATLRVAIEKDLECLDAPPEDRDPEAFPRADQKAC
ncbi:MAG: hypothetical protein JO210_09915 [Acidobacteriaceae bacterium]|nr:hypothetical protein [Acidobacteriaceae bacterium]